jgi:hypothetical protein
MGSDRRTSASTSCHDAGIWGCTPKRVKIRSADVLNTDSVTPQTDIAYEKPSDQCIRDFIESVKVRIQWTLQKTENEGSFFFKRMWRVSLFLLVTLGCLQR